MTEHSILYFVPPKGEFLKTQPGTGDNLLREDIAEGYTDYVIWNRFRPLDLGIDGELEMECVDSGMLLLKGDSGLRRNDEGTRSLDVARDDTGEKLLREILEQAYGDGNLDVILLFS